MTQPDSPSFDDYVVIPETSQLSLAIRLRANDDNEAERDLVHVSDQSDDAVSIISLHTNEEIQSPQVIADPPEVDEQAKSPISSPPFSRLGRTDQSYHPTEVCSPTDKRDLPVGPQSTFLGTG